MPKFTTVRFPVKGVKEESLGYPVLVMEPDEGESLANYNPFFQGDLNRGEIHIFSQYNAGDRTDDKGTEEDSVFTMHKGSTIGTELRNTDDLQSFVDLFTRTASGDLNRLKHSLDLANKLGDSNQLIPIDSDGWTDLNARTSNVATLTYHDGKLKVSLPQSNVEADTGYVIDVPHYTGDAGLYYTTNPFPVLRSYNPVYKGLQLWLRNSMANLTRQGGTEGPLSYEYGHVYQWARYEDDYKNGELEKMYRDIFFENDDDGITRHSLEMRYIASHFNNLDEESARIGRLVGIDLEPPDALEERLGKKIAKLGLKPPPGAWGKGFAAKVAKTIFKLSVDDELKEAADNITSLLNATARKQLQYSDLLRSGTPDDLETTVSVPVLFSHPDGWSHASLDFKLKVYGSTMPVIKRKVGPWGGLGNLEADSYTHGGGFTITGEMYMRQFQPDKTLDEKPYDKKEEEEKPEPKPDPDPVPGEVPDDKDDEPEFGAVIMNAITPRLATNAVASYAMKAPDAAKLARAYWDDGFLEAMDQYYNGSISTPTLGLRWFYGMFRPIADARMKGGGQGADKAMYPVKIGKTYVRTKEIEDLDEGVSAPGTENVFAWRLEREFATFTMRPMKLWLPYNDYRNYTMVDYKFYLPFVGLINIDPNTLLGHRTSSQGDTDIVYDPDAGASYVTVFLKYIVNLTNGQALCMMSRNDWTPDPSDQDNGITRSWSGNSTGTFFTQACEWGYDIPIVADPTNVFSKVTGALGTLASTLAFIPPANVAGAGLGVLDAASGNGVPPTSVGSLSGDAGILADFIAKAYVTRREDLTPQNYRQLIGSPATYMGSVAGAGKGYIKAASVSSHNANGTVPSNMKDEIVQLLKEGVYVQ